MKRAFFIFIVLSVCLVFAGKARKPTYGEIAGGNRYELKKIDDSTIFVIDKKTGKVWILMTEGETAGCFTPIPYIGTDKKTYSGPAQKKAY